MNRARAIGAAALVLATGCHRAPTSDAPPPSSATPVVVPADHLSPGELIPGTEHAFGLTLPRGFHVDGAFPDAVFATGYGDVASVARYFRNRLQDGDLRQGGTSATFEHVHAPGDPGRELRVHLETVAFRVRIEVHDATPPPAPVLPDEKARWRQVGLTPDGHLADPTHLD
jgi:hypothetical protein